jgi:hypothetical protein
LGIWKESYMHSVLNLRIDLHNIITSLIPLNKIPFYSPVQHCRYNSTPILHHLIYSLNRYK